MSLYTIAKAHSLPPNATIDLEELINSIQTEKAAELQAVHLDYHAQLAALNTKASAELASIKTDLEGEVNLRQEKFEKHTAEIEALKKDHEFAIHECNGAWKAEIQKLDGQISALKSQLNQGAQDFFAYQKAAETAARAAQAAIANKSLDDAQTVAKIEEITTAVLMPVEERKKQEATARIAAIKKEAGLE